MGETEDKKPDAGVPAVAVPDYLKKFQVPGQSQPDAASMATASISVPRLSYRGKRWRFIVNKEEELVPTLTVKVVILGVEPDAGKFIKTYYKKGYQPGDSDPPTCSSADGIRPDAWVPEQQSTLCAPCPQNVFGSATSMSGGKARACKDGKLLWVCKPGDPEKLYGLKVPVMSLKNMSEYGKYIGRNHYPLALVVTELGMDETAEYPKLTFSHAGFIEEKFSEQAIQINSERPWRSTFANAPLLEDAVPQKQIPSPSGAQPQTGADSASGKSVDDVVGTW